MDQIVRYFFDFSLMAAYWPDILRGFLITVQMSVLTILIGIPLGLALAILRLYGIRPLNWLIIFYIDFFRAIPQLVLIVLAYFALPYFGLVLEPMTATVLALAIVLSAFAEEIFWAGINAVPKGQWEAGRSTGLSFTKTLAYIILPQVVRISIPPLTNRAIGISKGTTLGSVVAVPELLNVTSSIQSNVANPTALTVGALLFLVLFLPFVRFTRWLERAYAHPRS
ncbi:MULTISPECIES: amino acid ABC transporter permease [Bosea]|uniref:amino acid ABC transporter permease n=1 Tax=Bosea TaxID=85413 RepID=UPI00214F67E1|nr:MULTISPECIES: amino acid ABC transporter permease [Bosea]MCR4523995.1 amino acid ABC transporter permease [Bosea sp. 47.2.35]MDR6831090.1 polar amino acid transport system permease protein [Bosea robiniae]MDR6897719.1 polar amino acid transport system permease protein [Bosea sp. BE109]MDR7141116.1 polar amino acid transport system permease protein [Bosea sp. BE168]MDR7177747.1 polar amino acid transport system permease protein [Bosea sp. BE271]